MIFSYDLAGGNTVMKEMQIFGSTISEGAAVIRGTTSGTNFGGYIVGASPFTDFVGVVYQAIPGVNSSTVFNQTPSVQSTGVVLLHKVIINPFAVYRIEYSQTTTDTFTGTMTSSGTTITCASLEDLTGGFIYDITSGFLGAIVGGSGVTTLTAFSPAIASSDYVLKIHANFSKLCDLNTTATLIGGTGQSQAAAGSGIITILDTYIQADTIPLQKLRPDLHNGLNLLNKHPRFFADIMFTKSIYTHQS
jgi:hypothetical protein